MQFDQSRGVSIARAKGWLTYIYSDSIQIESGMVTYQNIEGGLFHSPVLDTFICETTWEISLAAIKKKEDAKRARAEREAQAEKQRQDDKIAREKYRSTPWFLKLFVYKPDSF